MDIDSLTEKELLALVEGFYCYPTEDGDNLQNILAALIEWHETSEEKLLKGLGHWAWDTEPYTVEDGYDYSYRKEHLFG
jgi:hypothetical protein